MGEGEGGRLDEDDLTAGGAEVGGCYAPALPNSR